MSSCPIACFVGEEADLHLDKPSFQADLLFPRKRNVIAANVLPLPSSTPSFMFYILSETADGLGYP